MSQDKDPVFTIEPLLRELDRELSRMLKGRLQRQVSDILGLELGSFGEVKATTKDAWLLKKVRDDPRAQAIADKAVSDLLEEIEKGIPRSWIIETARNIKRGMLQAAKEAAEKHAVELLEESLRKQVWDEFQKDPRMKQILTFAKITGKASSN